MYISKYSLTLLSLCTSKVLADYLTPTYPPPTDLGSNTSLVSAAWKSLSSTFDDYLAGKNNSTSESLSGVENVTFSFGMFSLHDPAATKFQYHYTAPEIVNSKVGTNKVDGDSIYRVASVSKLITTFAGLVELAEEDWHRPLSDIVPALRDYVQADAGNLNPIDTTQWDKITPWSLATQQSGIATLGFAGADYAVVLGGLALNSSTSSMLTSLFGLPAAVNISILGPCATRLIKNPSDTFCSGPDAIAGVKGLPPNFLPWTAASYSDEAFMLLGLAISNITGKPLSDIYQNSVFKPLYMDSSNDTHATAGPKLARSVVSGDPAAGFGIELGFTTPSGGILSTVNDLSKLGIGIMNNTLLSAETTRKWMKPQTHTASLSYSIGGPWEIHRYVHPTSGKVTDLYTKLGDSGYYGGALVIIPQYDAGFTMLNAFSGDGRSHAALTILDYITSTILPALEAQAAAEALSNYVGTYVSTDKNLNASITIAFNQSSVPGVIYGLSITSWSFNNSDVLAGPLWNGIKPRLEPTIPKQTPDGSPGQVAFVASLSEQTLTYMDAMKIPGLRVIGSWTGIYISNGDVFLNDDARYGGVSAGMIVFDVDGSGKAISCSPAIDRVTLQRSDV